MSSQQSTNAKYICEQILLEEKRYNIQHGILPSEIAVADRMLARSPELREAYEELHDKLSRHPRALPVFFGVILSTAAFWNPDKIEAARTARRELEDTNRQIATKARELAALLQTRSNLHNTSSFSSDTHYHVCQVIESASEHNGLFSVYLQKPLNALSAQFDLKYWPSLSDIMHELAVNAEAAAPEASDPVTSAATVGLRPSLADFFKALFAALEEQGPRYYGPLPKDLRITDNTFASLVNSALDLDPDKLVDGPYVKRLRQRVRGAHRMV
jgi:hypothetical protein